MSHRITTTMDRKKIQAAFEKIVVNTGVGRMKEQANFKDKILPQIARDLATLAGQAPQTRPSKQSIAGFKTREGDVIGLKVTLRGGRMVDFFLRFVTIVLPRVRDFNGISLHAVDDGGVLNIGLKEHYVFSEIHPEESTHSFSLQVSVVPKRHGREEAIELYQELGVPFKNVKHETRNTKS